MRKRRRRAATGQQSVIRHGGGSSVELSCRSKGEPVDHLAEHIPAGLALTRRPTRDDREEELAQLRTADGRVMALVERVDPSSLPN